MRKRDGYTLVEVVISILLTAVMVSCVFSIALSAKTGGGKADRKLLGSQAMQALTDELKPYVAGDPNQTLVNGPNWVARGAHTTQSWNLYTPGVLTDNDCTIPVPFGSAAPTITAGNLDRYALTPGNHCLRCIASTAGGADSACFLPAYLRNAPYNGMIFYTVTATTPPRVQVGVYWDEP